MAFKKLIWHFYVAVAFHRLPGSGRVLSALYCSNSFRAPSPSPWKGLHRTRERAGELVGARRCLPRGAGAASGRGGCRRGCAGALEAGNDPRALPPPPRDSPAGPRERRTRKAVLQPPSPPPAFPHGPVIALERFSSGAHLPRGELASLCFSVPLSPPVTPFNGLFDYPTALHFILLVRMALGFLAKKLGCTE